MISVSFLDVNLSYMNLILITLLFLITLSRTVPTPNLLMILFHWFLNSAKLSPTEPLFSIGLFLCGINFHFQLELLPVWLPSRVSLLSSTSPNSVMVLIHTIHALGCHAVGVLIAGPHNSVVFLSVFVFLFSFWVGGVVIGGGRGEGDLSLFLILVRRS